MDGIFWQGEFFGKGLQNSDETLNGRQQGGGFSSGISQIHPHQICGRRPTNAGNGSSKDSLRGADMFCGMKLSLIKRLKGDVEPLGYKLTPDIDFEQNR